MVNYKRKLDINHKIISKYCRLLKRSKRKNIKINKMNELILSKFKCYKLSTRYNCSKKIFLYLKKYIVDNNYKVDYTDVISMVNKYQDDNKYHLLYWEIEEIPSVLYYILITELAHIIEIEPNSLLIYTIRKEKLIFNIFNSISNIIKMDKEIFIQRISDVDKELLKYDEYKKMDALSRSKYREQIKRLSKEHKISEYELVSKIINKLGNKSIGSHLFKRINYKLVNVIVIIISLVLAIIIFYLMKKLLNINIIINILMFFINYLFIYKKITQIVPKEFIPKISFQNISREIKCMCCKYCILKNTAEVLEQFKNLEEIYLGNNDSNMDFTLLVDCTDCDHQIEPFDDEILETGLKECDRLNKLYGSNKFYFVYRKRIHYPNGWYGYNRRNGAIEQFCKLLLDKVTSEEDYKYFTGHSAFNKQYKYIIEIDESIKTINLGKLIEPLEHPYNKPIIRDNKLVYGYAMTSIVSKNQYGECNYNFNGSFNLDIYNNLLIDKMPYSISRSTLLRSNSLHCKNINNYDIESITKNNIHSIFWMFNKNNYFNLVQKISILHNNLNIIVDLFSLVLLLLIYFTNQSPIWLLYLVFFIPSFSNLPNRCFVQMATILKIIFSKKYRYVIVEKKDIKFFHWFNYLFFLLLIALGYLLSINLYLVVIINALFIINDLIMFIGRRIRKVAFYD